MEEHEKMLLLELAEKEIGPQPGDNFFPNVLDGKWEVPIRKVGDKDWLLLKQILRTRFLKKMLK